MDLMSLVSGGATGLLGSVLTSVVGGYIKYKNKKLDLEDRQNEREHRLKEMNTEAEIAESMENLKIADRTDERDSSTMQKAMDMIKGQLFKEEYVKHLPRWIMVPIAFMFAMVDILRAFVRPGGTLYLLVIMSAITYKVYENDPGAFYESVVDPWSVIAYMGSTSFMWWFGDRRLAKAMATRLGA